MATINDFVVSDPVHFQWRGSRVNAHIARKTKEHAVVVSIEGRIFRVPWILLRKDRKRSPRRIETRVDNLKGQFRTGDEVAFHKGSEIFRGRITRLNPKRARVLCDDEQAFFVPYRLLKQRSNRRGPDQTRLLESVACQAEQMMAQHGLKGWSFQYDDASRRAGVCNYVTKVIGMARQYCLEADEKERTNTILHEIAHALVGPKHNHDKVWKETARAIGCSGDRCHNVTFAPARYIVSCPRCGLAIKRDRRLKGAICKACRVPLAYAPYSEEAWQASQRRAR